jgi:hypothetical protein
MLCNSRNAKHIIYTSISDSLVGDDHLNRCDDGGLSVLSAVRTEGSFPQSISPFPASSPGGVSPWGRWRSAVRHAIHSREPILVGHHPLIIWNGYENSTVYPAMPHRDVVTESKIKQAEWSLSTIWKVDKGFSSQRLCRSATHCKCGAMVCTYPHRKSSLMIKDTLSYNFILIIAC